MRILVIRADRLGDVILSTPVILALARHARANPGFADGGLDVLVRPSVAPLLRGLPGVREVLTYDPEAAHQGYLGWKRLRDLIRARGYDVAIALQSQPAIATAVLAAGVARRIGPLSKAHSYLCYNEGVRQSRSRVKMHEADYNLELLRPLGIEVPSRSLPTQVSISPEVGARAHEWLKRHGWTPGQAWIGVHPGMGGSALNWPEAKYTELVRTLLAEGRPVLLTGGPGESALLARIAQASAVSGRSAVRFVAGADPGTDSIEFLGALYAELRLVIAPSTGPLHLAVALGRRVVTFYPPIRVQSPKRWGPYLHDSDRASVLVPEVADMNRLTVDQALGQVRAQLDRLGEASGGSPNGSKEPPHASV